MDCVCDSCAVEPLIDILKRAFVLAKIGCRFPHRMLTVVKRVRPDCAFVKWFVMDRYR